MAMFYTPYRAPLAAYAAYKSYGSRTGTQRGSFTSTDVVTKRKRRTGKVVTFKKKMLDATPAKHQITTDLQTVIVGMTHNTIYTCNLTAGIIQGTGDAQRTGDSVQLSAVKLNGLLSSNPAITASCQIRVIVGYSGEEYNVPNTFSAAGLTATELFQAGTGSAWANTGIINPKAFTVLDDRIVTLNNSISLVADIEEIAYTVPCNTTFPYQSGGSRFGKTRNLYIVVIGCSLNGTSGVTNSGSVSMSTDLIFKQV